MKSKTDTNGYPFEQVNRSVSVHHPFKHLKKSVQSVQQNVEQFAYYNVQNTLASIQSIATSVGKVSVCHPYIFAIQTVFC